VGTRKRKQGFHRKNSSSHTGWLQHLGVEEAFIRRVRGNHQHGGELISVNCYHCERAWAISSNLLDYPEENRLKSGEQEGYNIERHAD